MRIFGRDPVLIMAFISSAIAVLSSLLLHLSDEQQGVLNALAVALFGFIAAAMLARDKAVPALVGLIKAVIAVAIAFGLHLAPEVQGLILTLVATGAALLMRPQVTASVPEGSVNP
jgi:hypothetical protein